MCSVVMDDAVCSLDMAGLPYVTLRGGCRMPLVGFGTWKTKKGEAYAAVCAALEAGYRHLDCAHVYVNEEEVGNGIQGSGVPRSQIFITSKLWNTFHHPSAVRAACDQTLAALKTNYLDLYLMHWPMGFKPGEDLFPLDENDKVITDGTDFLDTWEAMEALVDAGVIRALGLSNFNRDQIRKILNKPGLKHKPVVNQIESHPYLTQDRLIAFCREHGIEVTAYSPLGSPDRSWASVNEPKLLEDPCVCAIASKHKKTPAQVLIRFHVQRGVMVIPKSVTKARIHENIQVFDFELTADDMKSLTSLNKNWRACPMQWAVDHKDYPFNTDF
uniref:alcohol dehydrogenase (NADP(+)) n=2 Tax=Petromyzon marinus TaxID=7757 RepID=A0AAJ7TK89_PETMA|nr:aldo-keto reductase family 1 member B1-like isoform X1 [Petromyzon marinus]